MRQRRQPVDDAIDESMKQFRHAAVEMLKERSDRAIVIVGATFLDDQVRRLLEASFVDDKISRELLGRQRALGDFSARVDVAFAMGVIPKWVWTELDVIRKIRNHFAHNIGTASFGSQPASQWVQQLSVWRYYHRTRKNPKAAPEAGRLAFKATCAVFAGLLHSGMARRRIPHRLLAQFDEAFSNGEGEPDARRRRIASAPLRRVSGVRAGRQGQSKRRE